MEFSPIVGNTLHRDTAYRRNKKKTHEELSTLKWPANHFQGYTKEDLHYKILPISSLVTLAGGTLITPGNSVLSNCMLAENRVANAFGSSYSVLFTSVTSQHK